ncbi:MAG: sugar ABC transporter substrate-binding protein [Clostridiales bacterium]|uniref:ABC transporter substrate-binding protein n=1 Tax=Chordicoccus furentiruminis TaxID=2709410 RepID=UPI0023A82BAC|nr:sugar ABC transporter substrate-binding protein [Chordicoccus furentiruminis]MCI6174871.1 sugar ABC transporter substrate-binding protein [Clostridiales bacterium]
MKAKKLAAVVLTAATASSMLVGGSASVFAASSATEPAADLNQGDASTAKIVIWSPTDEQGIENWWAEKITAWNQEHPDLTIARQAIDRSDSYAYENKITTATTSNDLPDILFVDGPTVSYYAANGTIIPIDDVYTDEDKKDFMPSSIQQNTYDDHLYAIGPTESSVALYYNKDYLDKAGIEYPSDTDIKKAWTWDQFYENAKKLTTDDYVGTNIVMDKGEGLIYALEPFFLENGANFVSDDGSKADGYVNSKESVETMEYLNKFIQEGLANVDPVKDEFLNGKAATMLGGSWNIADLEKSDLNWGVSYYPVSNDGKAVSPTGDWTAAVTKDCEDPDSAKQVLQYLMSTDNVADYASAIAKPASRTSSYDKMTGWDEGARKLFLWQLQNTGVARPRTPSYSVLSQGFATAILNVFSGSDAQTELDTVASDFQDDYDTYYAQ